MEDDVCKNLRNTPIETTNFVCTKSESKIVKETLKKDLKVICVNLIKDQRNSQKLETRTHKLFTHFIISKQFHKVYHYAIIFAPKHFEEFPQFPQQNENFSRTKFYYIIPDKGVGHYENRFLTPMSPGVWWCSAAAGVVCALVLIAAAAMEGRPEPGSYGIFSVLAAGFQQGL